MNDAAIPDRTSREVEQRLRSAAKRKVTNDRDERTGRAEHKRMFWIAATLMATVELTFLGTVATMWPLAWTDIARVQGILLLATSPATAAIALTAPTLLRKPRE